ncbi:hypothetical protein MMC12_003098 [Toensbergia leucococca]|nr:hypothetical protein [Toensbergia leucococca]
MYNAAQDQTFPLPQVVQALTPFIKTRQETLHIRRVLTIFLSSQIHGLESSGILAPTFLATPSRDFQTNRQIPPELTGIRRDYLVALQAHIKARDEFDRLGLQDSDEITSNAARQRQDEREEESREFLAVNLALQQERQKYEKLRILRDYLDLLAKKEAAMPDYLNMDSILKDLPNVPEMPMAISELPALFAQSESNSQALTAQLEKAVLRAKHALDKEKRLLTKVKEYKELDASIGPSQQKRTSALSQTRDELIKWIEYHLVKSNESNNTPEDKPQPDQQATSAKIEQRKKDIKDRYEEYLTVRKSLIEAVSNSQTPPSNATMPAFETPEPPQQPQKPPPTTSHPTSALTTLPYLTTHLLPASAAQKAYLHQSSHLTTTLSTQTSALNQVLEKLSDESHLLPAYPLLASQPRFKNAVAALGPPKLLPSPPFGEKPAVEPESYAVKQARAWAFAAEEARSTALEAGQKRMEAGRKSVESAKGLLEEVRELFGVVDGNEDDEGDYDLWADSARSNAKTEAPKPDLDTRKGSGWASIDGRVGVGGDGADDVP